MGMARKDKARLKLWKQVMAVPEEIKFELFKRYIYNCKIRHSAAFF